MGWTEPKIVIVLIANVALVGVMWGRLSATVSDLKRLVCDGLTKKVDHLLEDVAAIKATCEARRDCE
jgi:hypothetical protein